MASLQVGVDLVKPPIVVAILVTDRVIFSMQKKARVAPMIGKDLIRDNF